MSKSDNPGCTISLDGMVLLTIALAVLRAYDKITCSWWWVFAPMWGPVALVVGTIVGILAVAGLVGAIFWVGLGFATGKRWWRNRNG